MGERGPEIIWGANDIRGVTIPDAQSIRDGGDVQCRLAQPRALG